MKVGVYASAVLVATLPAAAVLAFVSQISPLAAPVLAHLAAVPRQAAYTTLFATVALALVLWLFSRDRPLGKCAFWTSWWLVAGLATLTAVLLVPHHPCFSIAAIAFLGPTLLYPLRNLAVPSMPPSEWFNVAWVAAAAAAVVCLAAWLPWIVAGFEGRQRWTDWQPFFRGLVQQHAISWKCAFASWACPPAMCLELGIVAVLCWVRQRYTSVEASEVDDVSPGTSARQVLLASSVKQVAGWLFALVLLIWIQATMNATGQQEFSQTREDMSDEVVGLAFLLFLTLSVWVLDTLGPEEVAVAVQQSKMVQETAKLLQNDWVRAFLFLIAGVPIGLLLGGDAAFYWMCGRGKAREVKPFMQWTEDWRWTSVLVKASWLGQIYVFIFVGIGKLTTVLLAVINAQFSGWPVFTVSAVMFVITLAIFMFPASPGPPIYVVMGIVICSSAQERGWSFAAGLAWATLVAYVMKLAFTALAQKFVGEPFSGNDRVRRLVGVHTPYMRAIERILREPGVTLAKVSLLVGGPDWPVAVLCGILRLSVLSVQLCISPVLLQSVFPSVLAGALLLNQSAQQERTAHGVAEVTLVIAGGLQLLMGVIAFYYVQEVLERNYEELSRSRPEDAHIEQLEERADARDRAFWRESAWEMLPTWLKVMLIGGLLCIQASIALLSVYQACFKKFGLMSSVDKDLDGSALAIVQPWGWVAVGLAATDSLVLAAFYTWCRAQGAGGAGTLLEKEQAEKEGRAIL
mmetsp:Transcript_60960/g.178232  ORF Transcript_60960/g.178232 Transcript_60960/m.178232 type:complete len:744 (+) Transcript_60960:150-2381(+)